MNKENKKSICERLKNSSKAPAEKPKRFAPIQRPRRISKHSESKTVEKKQEKVEPFDILKSHEEEQAERRRLLEEYRKKKELERLKNRKPIKPKRSIEIQKPRVSRTVKTAFTKSAPISTPIKQNEYRTPVRNPRKPLPKHSKNTVTPSPTSPKDDNNIEGTESNMNIPMRATAIPLYKRPGTPFVTSSTHTFEEPLQTMAPENIIFEYTVPVDKEPKTPSLISVPTTHTSEEPQHFISLDKIKFYDGERERYYYVDNDADPVDKELATPTSVSMNSTPIRGHSKIYSSPVIKVSGKPQRVSIINQTSDDAQKRTNPSDVASTPTTSPSVIAITRRRSKIYSSPSMKVSGKAQRVKVQISDEKGEASFTPESVTTPAILSTTTQESECTPTTTRSTPRRRSKIYQSPTLKLTGKAQRMKVDPPKNHHPPEKDNGQTVKLDAAQKVKPSLTPLNPRERSLIYSGSLNRLPESQEDNGDSTNLDSTPKRSIHPIFKFKAQNLKDPREEKNDTNNTEDDKVDDNTDQDIELKIQNFFTSLKSLPTSVKINENMEDISSSGIGESPVCPAESDAALRLDYESAIFENNENQQGVKENANFLEHGEKEEKTECDKKVVVDLESMEESSLTVLTPVKAKKKEREEFGISSVVTPVRRSARNQKNSPDVNFLTPEDQVRKLLEENGFTYIPNPALNRENNLAPLKKTPKKGDEENSGGRSDTEKQKSSRKSVRWEDFSNLLELVPKNF
ncbi:6233_t:CDS:2 [Acaulospora colombiana]|uniref:6233_t:CDS:1 n=1 Tax=Acaulospora colombiana TaxID=27376 RepID=A0ACA9JUV9_9GLOM|nr:6233_t:CDS:2 [Acaulospora colombiana]